MFLWMPFMMRVSWKIQYFYVIVHSSYFGSLNHLERVFLDAKASKAIFIQLRNLISYQDVIWNTTSSSHIVITFPNSFFACCHHSSLSPWIDLIATAGRNEIFQACRKKTFTSLNNLSTFFLRMCDQNSKCIN